MGLYLNNRVQHWDANAETNGEEADGLGQVIDVAVDEMDEIGQHVAGFHAPWRDEEAGAEYRLHGPFASHSGFVGHFVDAKAVVANVRAAFGLGAEAAETILVFGECGVFGGTGDAAFHGVSRLTQIALRCERNKSRDSFYFQEPRPTERNAGLARAKKCHTWPNKSINQSIDEAKASTML